MDLGLSGLSGSVEPKCPQLKVELVPGAGWTLPWLSFVSCSVCGVHGKDFSPGEEWGWGGGVWFGNFLILSQIFTGDGSVGVFGPSLCL